MGFRINKGIFQFSDGTKFINKFKIDDRGDMVEVDDAGNPVTSYMRIGDKATDADKLDGIDSGSFIRSNADDNVSGNTEWQDNKQIRLGNGADLRIWHDGSNHVFRSYHHGANYYFQLEDNEGTNRNAIQLVGNTSRSYVILYEDGNERLRTTSDGVQIGKLSVGATTGTWIKSNAMSDAIGWNTSHGVYIGSNIGGTHYLRGNGTFTTGGSTYKLWHEGNDGSGSGLDADLLDGSHRHEIGNRDYTKQGFYVDGDENTYYPVLFSPRGGYAFNRWSISRRYSWTAPYDPIGTGNHKAGLTFDFYWAGDTAWGGNDKSIRVHQFSEQYTTTVGGIALARTGGMIVWLRGGHAYYELQTDCGQVAIDPKLEPWTDGSGTKYSPTTDVNQHKSSIWNNYPVRNGDDLYVNNEKVATEAYVTSRGYLTTSGKAADSNKLDGIDSSQFLRSDANDTHTGTLSLTSIRDASGGTITNAKGSYLHLGSWAKGRTDAGAVLVNTAYRSDILSYSRNFTIGNTTRSFNGSGNVSWTLAEIGAESAGSASAVEDRLNPLITDAKTTASNAATAAAAAQATANTAETRANGAKQAAADALDAAEAAQTTANSKLGATAKAADSNKLDGIDSGSFLRSDADDTLTQTLVVDQTSSGSISYRHTGGVYVPRPNGGSYSTTASAHTGAIAIKLPTASLGDSDMLSFWVDIYDYAGGAAGESVSLYIYGYQYGTTDWTNCGAVILSDKTDRDYAVRFGHDGTRPIVWIGETGSTWNYLQISVRDFQAGYSGDDWDRYDDGWAVAVNQTSFGTVTDTSTANYPVSKYAFNADKLDGKNSTEFALTSHTHTASAVGADPAGSAAAVQSSLEPRITTAQTTADNAATAAAAAQTTANTAETRANGAKEAAADALATATAALPKAGGTMTGELQLNARLDVGNGTNGDHEIRIYKADNNVSDHIQFYNGTTRMGEIGCHDTTWLRINQVTNKNIYTPRYIRADSGFFVDGTSKGINGSGNFIGGTIAGASDANVTNWNTAYTHSQTAHAPSDAEKNVQSDWNATSGDAFIKNKPAIPAATPPVAFNDQTTGQNSTLTSMTFDGRAMIFTMDNGTSFSIDGARPNQ
jgi:hypothetical protein